MNKIITIAIVFFVSIISFSSFVNAEEEFSDSIKEIQDVKGLKEDTSKISEANIEDLDLEGLSEKIKKIEERSNEIKKATEKPVEKKVYKTKQKTPEETEKELYKAMSLLHYIPTILVIALSFIAAVDSYHNRQKNDK